MIFIEYIARYLRINRPKPFEIDMPKKDAATEDARTTSMCYDLELEGNKSKYIKKNIFDCKNVFNKVRTFVQNLIT